MTEVKTLSVNHCWGHALIKAVPFLQSILGVRDFDKYFAPSVYIGAPSACEDNFTSIQSCARSYSLHVFHKDQYILTSRR